MSLVGELLLHFKSVAPGRYNFMVLVGIGYTGGNMKNFPGYMSQVVLLMI